MKKIILGIVLTLIPSNAWANCPSGNCAVEINCTTGVVTYTDAPVRTETPVVIPEPVAPTHQVVIQTANQSMGFSGSLEAVTAQLAKITTTPQAPLADPCVLGTCTKVEVNATTGVTTISPLSLTDLAQRYKDAQFQYQRNLELAQAAQQALVTVIEPVVSETTLATVTDGVLASAIVVEAKYITAKVAKAKKTKVKTKKKAAIK